MVPFRINGVEIFDPLADDPKPAKPATIDEVQVPFDTLLLAAEPAVRLDGAGMALAGVGGFLSGSVTGIVLTLLVLVFG